MSSADAGRNCFAFVVPDSWLFVLEFQTEKAWLEPGFFVSLWLPSMARQCGFGSSGPSMVGRWAGDAAVPRKPADLTPAG
jgi:hypothetical protein